MSRAEATSSPAVAAVAAASRPSHDPGQAIAGRPADRRGLEATASDRAAAPEELRSPAASARSPIPVPRPPGPSPDPGARVRRASRLLRAAGGLILLASASTFLLQRWEVGDGVERYLLLLAHTVLLALAGLACGLGLKETKGARTFLMVALAGVPVHYQVLGGLLYSRFAWDAGPAGSGPFVWTAPSSGAALLALGLAAPVLAGVAFLGFRVLARARAGALTLAFSASTGLLLLPIRESGWMAGILAVQTTLVLAAFSRLSRDPRLATLEGRIARATLLVPPLLTLARAVVLYDPGAWFRAVVEAGVAGALLTVAGSSRPDVRRLLEGLALLPLGFAAFEGTAAVLRGTGAHEIGPIAVGLVFAAVLVGLSLAGIGGARYRQVAAWSAGGAAILQVLYVPGPGSAIPCLVVSLAVVVGAFLLERKAMLLLGLAGAALGLGVGLHEAVRMYSFGRWAGLAIAGTLAIVGASLLERYGAAAWTRFGRMRTRVRSWEV